MALDQIVDDTFEVGVFDVGLAPGGPEPAEIVQHEIDLLIVREQWTVTDALRKLQRVPRFSRHAACG